MTLQKVFASPFAWLLLILAVLEVVAYVLLPYPEQLTAANAVRNATTWRGWPEYVRAPTASSDKTVAIIGNSQAVGREMRDANDIYVAHLRAQARAQGLPLNIENWSLEGIRLAEIEMLSMQAVRRHVDLLVIVISPRNLDRGKRFNLDFGASDVDLLAGDPALWPQLLSSGLRAHTELHDVLKRSLLLHSHLARSRIAFHDVAANWLDPRLDKFVFGQRKLRDAHLPIGVGRPGLPRIPRQQDGMRADFVQQQLQVRRRPAFDTLFASLRRRLQDHGVRLLWVWMPLPTGYAGESSLRGVQGFQSNVCASIEHAGFECVDLSGVIPDDYFLPIYQPTHFSNKGHRLFAWTLYPLLRDAVH